MHIAIKMYFGHPINVYGTELENNLLDIISQAFPTWDIENPNQQKHADGYKRYMDASGRGMDYYFCEVLPQCQGGIFLPFRDGKYGTGVFGEAKFLSEQGCPVWQIDAEGHISKLDLESAQVLSVEETRERIRTPDKKSKPY